MSNVPTETGATQNLGGSGVEKAAVRKMGIVSLAIFSSRILGLIREVIFARFFGGEMARYADCFVQAFRTPNMLRDMFAEGALSTAFVTVFSKKIQNEGEASAWNLAQKVATLTVVFMSVVSLLGVLLAPIIIRLLAPGWDDDKIAFTVVLARIMYPFILLVSLAALVMGMLNAKKIFGPPALASTFFNLGSILGGMLFGWWMDPEFGPKALIGFSIGTLIGGACQLGFQLPWLWKAGFRWVTDFDWKDSGVRHILSLMWPAIIASGAVQMNVMLNSIFASYIEGEGPVSWLNYSFRLMQLPLGIFGVAVATVTLPSIARAAANGISPQFGRLVSEGLSTVSLFTLPSAIGLAILAEPIISLIYESGRFTANDAQQTASALRFYAAGLLFYSAIKVIQPAFAAIDKRFTPMLVSLGAVGINAVLNTLFVLILKWGHEALALSTAIGAVFNFSLLFYFMSREVPQLDGKALLFNLGKVLLAALLMAAICFAGEAWLMNDWRKWPKIGQVVALMGIISLASCWFLLAASWLKIPELKPLLEQLERRLIKR